MNGKLVLIFISLFLVVSLGAVQGDQLWQENGIPIRQGKNIDRIHFSVVLPDGVVYIWSDTRNGEKDIFAVKVGSD